MDLWTIVFLLIFFLIFYTKSIMQVISVYRKAKNNFYHQIYLSDCIPKWLICPKGLQNIKEVYNDSYKFIRIF